MHTAAPTPDTSRVKEEIIRYRSGLQDMLRGDSIKAGLSSNSPSKTPLSKTVSFNTRIDSSKLTDASAIVDLVMYKDSALTFLCIIVGTVLLSGGHFILSGDHSMTLLSAVCYLLLGKLSFNVMRTFFSPEKTGNLQGSPFTANVARLASEASEIIALVHDTFLNSRDPKLTLKVAAGLWALALLGRYMSIWSVITAGFVLAFTVPVTVAARKAEIVNAYHHVSTNIKSKWAALKLTRKQQASVLGFSLVVLWMRSSWSTRFLGLLLGCLAVRINLKPAEIDALRQRAEPYTSVMKKKARRMSMAATDFAYRSLAFGGVKQQ